MDGWDTRLIWKYFLFTRLSQDLHAFKSLHAEYIISVNACPSVLTTPCTAQLRGSTTGLMRPSSSTVLRMVVRILSAMACSFGELRAPNCLGARAQRR
jgi:hypothetical protein